MAPGGLKNILLQLAGLVKFMKALGTVNQSQSNNFVILAKQLHQSLQDSRRLYGSHFSKHLVHPYILPFLGLELDSKMWMVSPLMKNGTIMQYLRCRERNLKVGHTLLVDNYVSAAFFSCQLESIS